MSHAPSPAGRRTLLIAALSLTSAACTTTINARGAEPPDRAVETVATPDPTAAGSSEPSTPMPIPTTSATTTTSTTTLAPEPVPADVHDPACVVRAGADTSFEELAAAIDSIADVVGLWLENGRTDVVPAGTLIDVCPGNLVDDVDGQPLEPIDGVTLRDLIVDNVQRQQSKLNELFTGYGIADLEVDGISGPRTGQRLCAARLALGLDTTIADMQPGSHEQAALFSAATLPSPATSTTGSGRWVLIDRTCQIMFIGSGSEAEFVFPTSTGEDGFETRDQDRAEAFRFNPALENGGWHDSSEFPVGVDNPLNGNLYKPLYFDLGQAIHGANNVPPTPQSKGCARLRVEDQDTFVAWLGLDDATEETWRKDEMNVTVTVQGDFVPRDD